MKNKLLLCSLSLVTVASLASCGGDKAKSYKVGIGSVVSSIDTTAEGSVSQLNLTVASVVLGSGDKIVSSYIDEIQIPLTVVEGKVAYNAEKTSVKNAGSKYVESKKELGNRYGMSNAPKGDWYVQAAAFEAWTVGLKANQLEEKAAMGENKKPTGDLANSVTITVDSYIDAVVEAAANTTTFKTDIEEVNASAGISMSAAGAKVEVDIASAVFNGTTILAGLVDVYQFPLVVNEGKIEVNATATQTKDAGDKLVESKRELGERYGMSNAPKGDWYVQAAAYEAWIVGKNLADLDNVVGDGTKPAEGTDLASTVTINIDGFNSAVKDAKANANL